MKKSWRSRPLLIGILYFSMLSVGLINGMRSICTPLIKAELNIGYDDQGLMMAISNVVGMAAALLGGISLERLGTKKSILLYCLLLGASSVGMWWAPAFWTYAIFFSIATSTNIFIDTCKNDLNVRCFPKNFAVHASMVSFCVGFGGIIGPQLTSWLITAAGFSTRQLFLLSALLPLVTLAMTAVARFDLPMPGAATQAPPPTESEAAGQAQPAGGAKAAPKRTRNATLRALAMPITWLCGIGFALGNTVGKGMEEWALLYFADMFGTDPLTTGTRFMSLFFICMSAARFINGFIMEKAGYFRYYLILVVASVGLMAGGLLAGEPGMWLLALCGGITMSFWPIHGAIMLKSIPQNAASIVAAGYAISSGVRALSQWIIGQMNANIGPEWGFRLLLLYLMALFFVVLRMKKTMAPPPKEQKP